IEYRPRPISASVPVHPHESLLRDVSAIHADGTTGITATAKSGWRPLIRNGMDTYAWTLQHGRGEFMAFSADIAPSNNRLPGADNSLVFMNIASQLPAGRRKVLFDEYHQGFGMPESESGERSLWSAIGPGGRSAAIYIAVLAVIAVITANRRFGA